MSEQLPEDKPDHNVSETSFTESVLSSEIDLSAYVGRWVALAGNHVAGVGETAMSAERLGRRNRHRERLVLYYVEPPGGKPLTLPPLLIRIRPVLIRQEEPIFLVGGTVRDVLLGRSSHDLDFVVPRKAIQTAFKVANQLGAPAYVLDRERDAGRVMLSEHSTMLDFTSYRGPDLEADLRARDFTINAMALPVAANSQASLIDPCSGFADLQAKLIRLNHPQAIENDPVRGLRAIRLVTKYDFKPTPDTELAASSSAWRLTEVSTERVRDELIKAIETERPDDAIAYLHSWQILPVVLPEINRLEGLAQSPPHHETVLNHTISTLKYLADVERFVVAGMPVIGQSQFANKYLSEAQAELAPHREKLASHLDRQVTGGLNGQTLLRLGGLFHDVGKAETARVDADGRIRFFGHDHVGARITGQALSRLRLSNQAITHVKVCVAGHMRPLLLANESVLSRRAIYRFFRASQDAGLDIGLLAVADHLATYGDSNADEVWGRLLRVISQLFEHYFNQYEQSVRPAALLDGHELINELQIVPGPEVGRLLRLIEEGQAAGEINSRAEALSLARQETRGHI